MRRGLAPLLQPPDQPAGVVAAIAGQDIAPDDISCTTLTATGTIRAGAASSIGFTGRSILSSASDGVVLLSNAAGTDFSRLQFGGTTSSFPALARSSTELFVRLADDSNFAGLRCALITGSNDIFAGSAAGRAIGFASSSRLKNSADGTILLTNAASSDFGLLQFGGTTSSFPALKRSAAALQARLADDGGLCGFQARYFATSVQGSLTIATGAITVTGGYHRVETEGAGATDDLDTINGGVDGMRLVLRPLDATHTVVVKDGTGNIQCAGDFTMDNAQDTIELIFDSALSAWLELGRSDNGA